MWLVQRLTILFFIAFCLASFSSCETDDGSNSIDDESDDDASSIDDDSSVVADDDSIDDDLYDDDAIADDDQADDDVTDDDTVPDDHELWIAGGVTNVVPPDAGESQGFLLHLKQKNWSVVIPEGSPEYLEFISISSPQKGIAASTTQVYRFDGEQWNPDAGYHPSSSLMLIHSVLSLTTEEWVVGEDWQNFNPFAFVYRENQWTPTDTDELPLGGFIRLLEVDGTLLCLAEDQNTYPSRMYIARFDRDSNKWFEQASLSYFGLEDIDYSSAEWAVSVGTLSDPPFSNGFSLRWENNAWHIINSSNVSASDAWYFLSVTTPSPQHAWAVGMESVMWMWNGSFACRWDEDHWTRQGGLSALNATFTKIRFQGDDYGWVIGYTIDNYPFSPLEGIAFRFIDGDWQQRTLPFVSEENWALSDLAFVPAAGK